MPPYVSGPFPPLASGGVKTFFSSLVNISVNSFTTCVGSPNSIHFSSPVTICFKNGMFSLRLSRESRAEIWSRSFFSPRLTYVEPKHQSD